MGQRRKVTWGHALMQLGMGLRTAGACLSGALVSALVLGVPLIALLQGAAYPEPFALLDRATPSVSMGTWCWEGLVIAAGALLVGRAAGVVTAALGWGVLPAEHRRLLGKVALKANSGRPSTLPADRAVVEPRRDAAAASAPVAQVNAHR